MSDFQDELEDAFDRQDVMKAKGGETTRIKYQEGQPCGFMEFDPEGVPDDIRPHYQDPGRVRVDICGDVPELIGALEYLIKKLKGDLH